MRRLKLSVFVLVVLLCGPQMATFSQTPFFNYSKYLFGPECTLSLWVVSVDTTTGVVEINGADTRGPTDPFTWDWGDGSTTSGFFAQSHTYDDTTQNYNVTAISTYSGGGHDTCDVLVRFVPPAISPIPLSPVIAVHVPDTNVTLGTRLYIPPSGLIPFADTFFRVIPRSTLEYILSVAATEERDFVNDNMYLFNATFEEFMLRDPYFGGAYSLWYTDPVAFGVGDPFMQGTIDYSSLFHEMGHNFTLNTPAGFYYGGRIDGNANAIYSESVAQIFQHAAGYEVVNSYLWYGLSEDVVLEIRQQISETIKFVRSSYEDYLSAGNPFASWNDPLTPEDEALPTFMTIAYKFCEHAETSGLGYRLPLKRMLELLQGFNSNWEQRYDRLNNTANADTFRATLMVAAISYGFSTDMRAEFRLLDFPISDQVYEELYNSPVPIQLAWFTGRPDPNGRGVLLEWMTLSEVNNYGFEVQRRPDVQPMFETLPNSFIPGHGTTNEPQYYSFLDTAVVPGRWFYRLKQIDMDGTYHFSDAVAVDVSGSFLDGPFALRLVESDGEWWRLEVTRDSTWRHYDIPLSAFGGGGGFLNTPVTRFELVPIGGRSWGGYGNEVADWIDSVVVADTLIDDFEDGDFGDWLWTVALNGSYLRRSADSCTPDGSLRCLKLVHGNFLDWPFEGWMWKNFSGLSLSASDTLRFWLRGVSYDLSDVEGNPPILPESFALYQNYPNPFNASTKIAFTLPFLSTSIAEGRGRERSHVTLRVYDVLGREVATLVNEAKSPGRYSVVWDASGFPSGVYFYRLTTGEMTQTRKLVLLR